MVLDENVNIKVNTRNINTLKDNGFNNINIGDIIQGDINLLSNGSHTKINVRCDICGNEKQIQYRYYNESKSKYGLYACSSKCAQFKNKQTNIKKYGVDNVSKSDIIKRKKKNTSLNKYGVDNPFKSYNVKEKIKNGLFEKYGVDNVSKIDFVKEKRKKTNLERYGNEIFVNSEYFYNNVNYFRDIINPEYFILIKNKFKDKHNLELLKISKKENEIIYKLKCDNGCEHSFECESDMLSHRIRYNTILCTKCNPKNSHTKSGLEKKILSFIKSKYNGEILENYRINNKEIDIYIYLN